MADTPQDKAKNQNQEKLKLPKKLLVVEDEPIGLEALRHGLDHHGVVMKIAPDISSLVYAMNTETYDVALISMELRGGGGMLAAQKIKSYSDPIKAAMGIIMMSSGRARSKEDNNLGNEVGDIEYVQKPLRIPLLVTYLTRALARKEAYLMFEKLREKVINYKDLFPDFDTALQQIKSLLPRLGARGPLLMLELYEKAGKFEEAYEILKGLIAAQPENIQFINMMGSLLLKMGRLEQAREYLEKADQLAPSKIDRMEKMVDMYLKLGDPDKSVEKMGSLISLNPEKPDIKMEMIDKLCDHDYNDHAQSMCKDQVNPIDVVKYYNNKGVMLSKQGEAIRAVENYSRAIKFYPDFKENYRIHFNSAMALYNTKTTDSWRRALKELDRCLQLQPDFEKAIKLYSLIREKMDQVEMRPKELKSA
jgi:tetratricopeptide (TPR) repeat protein